MIPSELGPRLRGGPERAWGAFRCCLCIVGQFNTLHRAICLSHGSLAFTNTPSSSCTKFHCLSCPVFYYIHCYRPSHSQLHISMAQMMSHLLTQHPTEYSPLAPHVIKTLFLALVSASKSQSTCEGTIHGLVSVGKDTI